MDYSALVSVYDQLEKTTKRLEKTWILSRFLKTVPEHELAQLMLLIQGLVFPPWDERKLGLSTQLTIKAITTSTGISSDEVELLWKETGDLGDAARKSNERKQQVT